MDTALIIGGTRFIGRVLAEDFRDHGYDVTLFTRGNREVTVDGVDHVTGDRTNDEDLERAYEDVDPELVVDMVAYFPHEVNAATEIFADVDRYVFVSSTAAYDPQTFPYREGQTPLMPCTDEQARDDSYATYGNRKAECDRLIFEAAEEGMEAVSVRPTAVYGPYDNTERFDYWIDRVNRYDRLIVPGDGAATPLHLGYVEDVASGLRIVAEEGAAGEAYNAADRFHFTLDGMIELIANALGTTVEVVHATERELATVGLSVSDFTLCRPGPSFVATEKLAALGWASTPFEVGVERTVTEHLESDRDGSMHDPGRVAEEQLLDVLAGGVRFFDGT